MIEAVFSVCGMALLWICAVILHGIFEDSPGMWIYFIDFVLGAAAVYCVVRFVHWAWMNPMPFV